MGFGSHSAYAGNIAPTDTLALTGAGPVLFSPVTLADLNNDGRSEILLGTDDGKVFAVRYNPSSAKLEVQWSHNLVPDVGGPTTVHAAVSVGDLDGDGLPEVVAATGSAEPKYGGVVALNGATGATKWVYHPYDVSNVLAGTGGGDGIPDGIVNAPALGDLDGDGKLEVAFGGFDSRVHVLSYDGKSFPGWPRYTRDSVWSSPAIADLDNDGLPEVAIGIDTHYEPAPNNTIDGGALYVFHGDGRTMSGWPQVIAQVIYASPAVGDLNGDGQLEIVSGTGPYWNNHAAGDKVYVWSAQGKLLWTGATQNYVVGGPALADLSGVGKLDVISAAMDDKAYAWHHDGAALWSVNPKDFTSKNTGLGYMPIIADFDNNGKLDVLINMQWETIALNGANGGQFTATSPSDPKPYYPCGNVAATNAPAIGDVNGDGKLDLVSACADGSGTTGRVSFWSLNTPATFANAPWPMFGQNARHTRLYPRNAAFDARIVSHTLPELMQPGEEKQVQVTVQNIGTARWVNGQAALGAWNKPDPLGGPNRVALSASEVIAPNQTKTFSFTLRAPTPQGYYTAHWRMVNDSAGAWFGAAAQLKIKVGNQPNLQVLTTQGLYGAGMAPSALPDPPNARSWNTMAGMLKVVGDKRGYHLMGRQGAYWFGGSATPLPAAGLLPNLQDLVLGEDGIHLFELNGDGTVYICEPSTSCSTRFSPAPPTGIAARALAITSDGKGVYVADGAGNLYNGGNAPKLNPPTGLPTLAPQADIIRRLKFAPGGKGFYLMDIYGRIWNGGGAPALTPNYAPHIGEDWARDFELTEDGQGFYLLDKSANIYTGGNASPPTLNLPPTSTDDIGRDIELVDGRHRLVPLPPLTEHVYLPFVQR